MKLKMFEKLDIIFSVSRRVTNFAVERVLNLNQNVGKQRVSAWKVFSSSSNHKVTKLVQAMTSDSQWAT